MLSKQFSLIFLCSLILCCTYNKDEQPSGNLSKARSTGHIQNDMDSIQIVDVIYYPAFNNSSVLHLDRISGIGSYQVDSTLKFRFGALEQTITFPLQSFEVTPNNKRLWDERFIQSLRIDTTKPIPTDGMGVWIFYKKSQKRDSVYLGNSHPNRIDSVLLDQLNYLDSETKDKYMKEYLSDLKSYL
jgi:hypothetical protein